MVEQTRRLSPVKAHRLFFLTGSYISYTKEVNCIQNGSVLQRMTKGSFSRPLERIGSVVDHP